MDAASSRPMPLVRLQDCAVEGAIGRGEGRMRWIPVVLVTIMLALPWTGARAAEPRLALVVGNATYRHATVLANPANDARAVAAVLRAAGFTLVGGGPQIDLTRSGLERAVRRFGHDLGGLRGSPGGGAIG